MPDVKELKNVFYSLKVPGNQPLCGELRAQIVAYKDAGWKQIDIATRLKISSSAVCRCIKRNISTGCYRAKKSSGRPRCTTMRTDKLMMRYITMNPTASSSSIVDQLPPGQCDDV